MIAKEFTEVSGRRAKNNFQSLRNLCSPSQSDRAADVAVVNKRGTIVNSPYAAIEPEFTDSSTKALNDDQA